jgi:hypothetical protein
MFGAPDPQMVLDTKTDWLTDWPSVAMWLWLWVQGSQKEENPCGGGIEYLHCDPASHRRRRNGKSQILDSKIWSRVPRNSDLRKTALARASIIYERQTCRLVREGAPQKQERNCQTVINIWSWAPDGARHQDLLSDWPSVAMWLWLWSNSGRSTRTSKQEDGHGKFVVEKELKVGLWRPNTWLEDFILRVIFRMCVPVRI